MGPPVEKVAVLTDGLFLGWTLGKYLSTFCAGREKLFVINLNYLNLSKRYTGHVMTEIPVG